MKSAVQAFKLAFGFFIIPLMMAYSGLLWQDDDTALQFILAVLATLGLIIAFACGIEGRLFNRLALLPRALLLFIAALMLIESPVIRLAGLAMLILTVLWDRKWGQKESMMT